MKLKNKVLLTLAIFILGSVTLDVWYTDQTGNFGSSEPIIQRVKLVGYSTLFFIAIIYIKIVFPGRWRKEPNI
jgi:hypothetical protein